jgi:ribosomal protein S18 acetylase RimI-like enzyme
LIEIIEAVDVEHFAAGKVLIEEYAQSLGVDLCFQDFAEELEGLAKMYTSPGGCLLLARQAKNLVGCVAIRNLSGATCEMKRLYVRRTHRGLGVGRLLAEAAIKRAQLLGYARMVLDTLPSMTEAQALYESLGFQEIKGYYQNPLEGVRYMALEMARE